MKSILIKIAFKILNKYNVNSVQVDKDKLFLFNNRFFKIVYITYDKRIDALASLKLEAYEVSLNDKNK